MRYVFWQKSLGYDDWCKDLNETNIVYVISNALPLNLRQDLLILFYNWVGANLLALQHEKSF